MRVLNESYVEDVAKFGKHGELNNTGVQRRSWDCVLARSSISMCMLRT